MLKTETQFRKNFLNKNKKFMSQTILIEKIILTLGI